MLMHEPIAAAALLLSTPHLDPNGRTDESEPLAQLIEEEPLVGKMKCRRHVREEHERRRRDANLRRVEDAHMFTSGTHRRIRGGHLLDEFVQLRRRNTFAPRFGDPVDGLEYFRRALAGQRRNVEYRCVVEKLQTTTKRLVERFHEIMVAALHQIPLVRDDHDAATCTI